MTIDLWESVLNQSINNWVINQLFLPDLLQSQSANFRAFTHLFNQQLSCTDINKTISFWELFGNFSSVIFDSTHYYDTCRSFRSFGLNFKLQESGNVLQNLFPVHVIPINLKEVILINLSDLFYIQTVLMTMIVNVFIFLLCYLTVKNLLSGFELFLTVGEHSLVVHIYDDKSIRENTSFLHSKALSSCFWESWQYKAFLLFLNRLNLFFNKIDNDLIFYQGELFEITFDLLSELVFFIDLFF